MVGLKFDNPEAKASGSDKLVRDAAQEDYESLQVVCGLRGEPLFVGKVLFEAAGPHGQEFKSETFGMNLFDELRTVLVELAGGPISGGEPGIHVVQHYE